MSGETAVAAVGGACDDIYPVLAMILTTRYAVENPESTIVRSEIGVVLQAIYERLDEVHDALVQAHAMMRAEAEGGAHG